MERVEEIRDLVIIFEAYNLHVFHRLPLNIQIFFYTVGYLELLISENFLQNLIFETDNPRKLCAPQPFGTL